MSRDKLSASNIKTGLTTQFVGQNVVFHAIVTSTMAVAREEISQGAPPGTVVITEEQTAGRGRLGRSWLSPRGSIALSIILYPEASYMPSLTMVAALAAVHSIESMAELKADIKWPNDILIHGKKVCGILVESGRMGQAVCYAIVGIGMNVNMLLRHYPEIAAIATSLSDELGKEVSRLELVREVLSQFERWYLALLGGEPVYEAWRGRLITLGKAVVARVGAVSYEGAAESVSREGNLLLRQTDGKLVTIPAGDVTLKGSHQPGNTSQQS